jgi:N-acetylglucosaminyldiphosphoundecaprenol N-acetyl-beta-D-mannosaminyltransferase
MASSLTYVKRIKVLDIPVDILPPEHFEDTVRELLQLEKQNQIILLTFRNLLKARWNREFRSCVQNAALIIPVSKRIVRGARFLKQSEPWLYRPFPFLIRLLGALEAQNGTVYLLGGNQSTVRKSEVTLKASFPSLRFVGRFAANYSHDYEKNIILAIKKASPSLLLASSRVKGKNLWIYRNRKQFNNGIFVWNKQCFSIFSGKKQKPSEHAGARVANEIMKTVIRPWRILYIFLYFWYLFLLVIFRIKG